MYKQIKRIIEFLVKENPYNSETVEDYKFMIESEFYDNPCHYLDMVGIPSSVNANYLYDLVEEIVSEITFKNGSILMK